jgi:hypothetical protein
VSPFLRAAASVMLATHARSLDKDFEGISELEDAPANTGFVESGFAHLEQATLMLCGVGMGSCNGVAHASMLGAFQTVGGRRVAEMAAVRKQHRATGSSPSGMALDQADVAANEAQFEIKGLFKAPQGGALGDHSTSPEPLLRRSRRNKPRCP